MEKKYLNSIFNQWDNYKCIDVRTREKAESSSIPGASSLDIYNENDLKKLRKSGFSSPTGQSIMQTVASSCPLFLSKKPILLFDDKPFLLAQAIWQHFRPTIDVLIYKGGVENLLKEAEIVFRSSFHFITLYGESGSGKTELLISLANKGCQVLNLEEIANHQGSVFGNLQQKSQPSQDTFILTLAKKLSAFNNQKPIFVESEKFSLGKNIIPLSLTEQCDNGRKIRLITSKEVRIERLIREYAGKNDGELKRGIENLRFRLGKSTAAQISTLLDKKDYYKVADLALNYFDSSESYQNISIHNFEETFEEQDLAIILEKLNKKFG